VHGAEARLITLHRAGLQPKTRRTMMSITNTDPERAAEELAHAKRVVETTLEGWDLLTWNELLADDVRLSLSFGGMDVSQLGDLRAVGGNLDVSGKKQAKEVLQSIYGDLRTGLSVTTEVVSGYDAILLGNLAVQTSRDGFESVPMGVFMTFDPRGRVREMTIAAIDVPALTDAIRNAARAGLAKAA
jgi:hypothetical protein